MKDWVGLLTAIIQLVTAVMFLRMAGKEKKKGTPRKRPSKRK
jgi:hypothetical protein